MVITSNIAAVSDSKVTCKCKMKGTEVPNPRRILFCSCPCKVWSRVSNALSQALCNLSWAFLADFTQSDSNAPIRFVVELFSLANYTLLFVWIERQDYRVHMSSVLQVQQFYNAGIPLHTYCQWPIIKLAKNVSPRTKRPLATWSRFIRMHVFREKWWLIM